MTPTSIVLTGFFHRIYILLAFLLLVFPSSQAQTIIGIGTRYDDSFREWVITTDDDDIRGEMWMRWSMRNDWTEWDWRVGDIDATIEQKWGDDPNLWEIRCEGVTVNARTAWPDEFYRWKLSDGKHTFNWKSTYANTRNEWSIDDPSGQNHFQVYTYWEGDPREWVIIDDLPEDISHAMKVTMIFLSLHFSTPRI